MSLFTCVIFLAAFDNSNIYDSFDVISVFSESGVFLGEEEEDVLL